MPNSSSKPHLKPSLFWNIRDTIPPWLGILLSTLALFVPLLIWAVYSYSGWVSPMFLPTPTAVVRAGIEMFARENLLFDVIASCARVLAGFVIAGLVGVTIGILMGTFASMDSIFAPIVGTVRYMPVMAFVPLIVIWAGLGERSKITIIFLGIVFYNAIMVADAVKFIPKELVNAAYTLGANRPQVLKRVILPATFPSVLDTLRVNISGAWNFLVVAELVAAQNGLGFRIVQAQRFLQTEKVLFGIALIGAIGLILDYTLKWISRRLTPWADRARA